MTGHTQRAGASKTCIKPSLDIKPKANRNCVGIMGRLSYVLRLFCCYCLFCCLMSANIPRPENVKKKKIKHTSGPEHLGGRYQICFFSSPYYLFVLICLCTSVAECAVLSMDSGTQGHLRETLLYPLYLLHHLGNQLLLLKS